MYNRGFLIGIFDMLNITKIRFINSVSAVCCELTVGLLSDEFAEKITGKSSLMTLETRMAIIQSLKNVNNVVVLNNSGDIYNFIKLTKCHLFLYDDVKSIDLNVCVNEVPNISQEINQCNYDPDFSKQFSGSIGYTTGVFDLFHIGHLNLLKKAKASCDKLIVGVSTDELVREYKGKQPVLPFSERIEVVKNIQYVDCVVKQENMDKYEAWEKLKYNVLFHGDDWKGSQLYLEIEKKLEAVGVKMIYFTYTKGVSSTILSKKYLR